MTPRKQDQKENPKHSLAPK